MALAIALLRARTSVGPFQFIYFLFGRCITYSSAQAIGDKVHYKGNLPSSKHTSKENE